MNYGKVWYTVKFEAGKLACVKLDSLFFFEEVYYLERTRNGMLCTCPAGGSPKDCRHKLMVRIFQGEHKINTGWLYCYDTQEWEVPLNHVAIRRLG